MWQKLKIEEKIKIKWMLNGKFMIIHLIVGLMQNI